MTSRHVGRTIGTSLLALILVPGIALAQTSNTQPAANAPGTETTVATAPAPPKVVPQTPRHVWSGFYIGGTLGYGGGKADTSFVGIPDGVFSPDTLKPDTMGWGYGFYGGLDFQGGPFVGGVVVDLVFSNMDGSIQQTGFLFEGEQVPLGTISAAQAIDWYSTVRGRAGMAIGHMLYYGTAGIAIQSLDHRSNVGDSTLQFPVEEVDNKYGYVIGGGVEGKFARFMSWKFEYTYMNFGESDKTAAGIPSNSGLQVKHTWNSTSNMFMGGIGFRF